MSSSRHRAEAPGLRVRVGKLVLPVALATSVTGVVVTIGLANADTDKLTTFAAEKTGLSVSGATDADLAARSRPVSRMAKRVELEPEAVAKKFAAAELNLWTQPSERSKNVGTIEAGSRLAVTGKVVDGWVEILLKGEVRYVNADYVVDEKPAGAAAVAGVSGAPCADGSSIESGLTAGAIRMYRAVCAAFPALSSYGGWDDHGEHSSGRAIDFMITDPALGKAVAEWLRAHAAELNLYNVIWAQQIYTQERGGEGWRFMSDRGSATANHYDHVHASVY
ncbi:MAG TPA: SH3 domain-containing protein [Nocardioidaceae bacterium]|nr:SH3 domain-containing protein [Nocardioidaceae bacterium]